MRILRVAATYVAVLAVTLALLEFGSWGVTKAYRAYRTTAPIPDARPTAQVQEITSPEDISTYSSPDIRRDIDAYGSMPGTPYRYESYLVYQNRPWTSVHLNIAADGMRLNRADQKHDKDAVHVWLFGSSAVFGVTNGDSQTISAAIEAGLARRLPNRPIQVSNFGVSGYTSWQDFMHFNIRLSQRAKPAMVIFFNGVNDYSLVWGNERDNCGFLLDTAVGSDKVLLDGWETRAHGGIILWQSVFSHLSSLFSNTLELARLVGKAVDQWAANSEIAAWRESYRRRRDASAARVEKCMPLAVEVYLRNMQLAARLANDHGIKAIFIQQPVIFAAKKPFVGEEATVMEHSNYTTFALDDRDLEKLRAAPSYRLDQKFLWNQARFVDLYRAQQEALKALSGRMNVRYLEVEPVIDRAGAITVFSSTVHFTYRGAKLIGETIAEGVVDLLRPGGAVPVESPAQQNIK